MTDDETAVFPEQLLRTQLILRHIILHLSLSQGDHQLGAAYYLTRDLNPNTPLPLQFDFLCMSLRMLWMQPAPPPPSLHRCFPFTHVSDVTFSKQNSWSRSQAGRPQPARRAETHTNKAGGHFSNCWASQLPSEETSEDADSSQFRYLHSQTATTQTTDLSRVTKTDMIYWTCTSSSFL